MTAASEWVSAVADVVAATGTVGAVVVALFQDPLRRWLFPTTAAITQSDPEGELTYLNGDDLILMFHLRVTNTSKHRELRDCRLTITEVDRPASDGMWKSTVLAVPQSLNWAPQGDLPAEITIPAGRDAVADFGWYRNKASPDVPRFTPILRTMPSNFPGIVMGKSKARFRIELRAANLDKPAGITLEVDSLGVWNAWPPENLRAMITVRRIGVLPDERGRIGPIEPE